MLFHEVLQEIIQRIAVAIAEDRFGANRNPRTVRPGDRSAPDPGRSAPQGFRAKQVVTTTMVRQCQSAPSRVSRTLWGAAAATAALAITRAIVPIAMALMRMIEPH
jgi:hypothetical protein